MLLALLNLKVIFLKIYLNDFCLFFFPRLQLILSAKLAVLPQFEEVFILISKMIFRMLQTSIFSPVILSFIDQASLEEKYHYQDIQYIFENHNRILLLWVTQNLMNNVSLFF